MPIIIIAMVFVGAMIISGSKKQATQTANTHHTTTKQTTKTADDEVKDTQDSDPFQGVEQLVQIKNPSTAGPADSSPAVTTKDDLPPAVPSTSDPTQKPPEDDITDEKYGGTGTIESDNSTNGGSMEPLQVDGNELSTDVYFPDTEKQQQGKLIAGDEKADKGKAPQKINSEENLDPTSKAAFIADLRRMMENFPKKGYRIDKDGNVILPDGTVISGKEFMDKIMSEEAAESSYASARLFGASAKNRRPTAVAPHQDIIGPANANIFGMVENRVKKDRKNWGL